MPPGVYPHHTWRPPLCTHPGCARPHLAKGLCSAHYARLRHSGHISDKPIYGKGGTCGVTGCDLPNIARGMCGFHYRKWMNHGDPLWEPSSWITRFWTYVNKDGPVPDYRPDLGPCWLWTGTVQGGGYGMAFTGDRSFGAHGTSVYLHTGHWPAKGMHVDHLCYVKLCVNPTHLEVVTGSENRLRALAHARWLKQHQ